MNVLGVLNLLLSAAGWFCGGFFGAMVIVPGLSWKHALIGGCYAGAVSVVQHLRASPDVLKPLFEVRSVKSTVGGPMLKAVLLLLALVSLTACTSLPKPMQDKVAALAAFETKDLTTARDIAIAGQDKAGAQCLTYLAAKSAALQTSAANPPAPPDLSLPISDLERIRVAIHMPSVGSSFLEDLDLNCAALRTSIEIDAAKGALLGAGIAASGGATAPAAIAKILPMLMNLLTPAGL